MTQYNLGKKNTAAENSSTNHKQNKNNESGEGKRLDYALVSRKLLNRVINSNINFAQGSDHLPIELILSRKSENPDDI